MSEQFAVEVTSIKQGTKLTTVTYGTGPKAGQTERVPLRKDAVVYGTLTFSKDPVIKYKWTY